MTAIQSTNEKRYRNLTIPNGITYGSLVLALIGIYLLFKDQVILAIIFLTLTDVFDMADGYVARKFKMFSPLGEDLDNLVDVIAFVIPPFIIALMFGSNIIIVSAIFMVGCGVYRLARFNAEKTISGYRKGVSISPPAHLIYAAILISIAPVYLSIIYVIFGILMVSTIHIKKKHTSYFLMSIIVINLILATNTLV